MSYFLLKSRVLRWLMGVALVLQSAAVEAGTISGTYQTIPQSSQVNLSQEGPLDWVHWGTFTEFAPDRKAGVSPAISDYFLVGNVFVDEGPFQFSDNFNGYSWNDGTPNASVTNTTTGVYTLGPGSGQNKGFGFTVPADTTTRKLKVYVGSYAALGRFTATLSDGGSYSSLAVDNLSNGPSGIYTLTYAAGLPNQTLTVTFTVETQYDKHTTAVGNVTLQAAALCFATNNNPPTIAIISPARNSNFSSGSPITIQASAFDSDGTIASVEFFADGNLIGQQSTSPYSFVWNDASLGQHSITARATDNSGASFVSSAITVFVSGTGGSLIGSFVKTPLSVVLSAEGTRDWAHWGLTTSNSFDHKSGVVSSIPNYVPIGTQPARRVVDDLTKWSWAGGTPTSIATNSLTGVCVSNFTNGFELRLPASSGLRTLKLYVGVFSARGQLQAYLSDSSAPAYADTTLKNFYGQTARAYTLKYTAASENQTLIVRYTDDGQFDSSFGSASLLSATAIPAKPTISLIKPLDTAVLNYLRPVTILTTATNEDGAISSVTFYKNNLLLGQVTTPPFNFVWSNVPPGAYSLSAIALDVFGGTATSAPVAITVFSNPPPISITRPDQDAWCFSGTNLTVEATVVDPNIKVDSVDFYAGHIFLGHADTLPFSLVWSNVPLGSYALRGVSTDADGLVDTSASVNLSAVPNLPPSVSILTPINKTSVENPITITANASDSDGLITLVEFFSGETKVGESTTPPYSLTLSDVPKGIYSLKARAIDNFFGTNSAVVTVAVSNNPPAISITNPVSGSVHFENTNITIQADALDTDGVIQKVEFFVGNTLLGQTTNPPYNFVWTNVAVGSYSLTAKVTDDFGLATSSSSIDITVTNNNPPSATITAPANGAIQHLPGNLTITAEASDSDGLITLMEIFDGATKLTECSGSPCSFIWTNPPSGVHSFTVRAVDNWFGTNTSAAIVVTVTNELPSVAITAPLDGAIFHLPGTLTLTAEASDNDGAISLIEIFDGATKLSESAGSPCTFNWPNPAQGVHTLTARTVDNWFGTNTSAPVVITVTNVLPSVAITAPLSGTVFHLPGELTITAEASDSDGAISLVEIFDGGTKLSECLGSPCTFIWTNPPAGIHTLSARTVDNWFGTNTSAPVAVTVTNELPSVAITSPLNGAILHLPGELTITAEASDNDGSITLVEIFDGATKLSECIGSPCTFIWTNPPQGAHIFTARVVDNWFGTNTSSAIVATVTNELPVVAITTPASGTLFHPPTDLTITTEATDNDGVISLVEIFDGATKLTQCTESPCTFVWTNAPQGIHTLTARTVDNWFGTNTSAPIVVTITNVPPSIFLTNPVNGANFASGADITLEASAEDVDGTVQLVEFFEGTNLIGQANSAPFSFTWNNSANGVYYSLTARATDENGATTTSAPVSILVGNLAPTISITNPTEGAIFFETTNVTIQAQASDVNGTVALVEFFEGTNLIGTVTNAPYDLVWSNVLIGNYSYTAVATDNEGASTTSAAVNITIVSNAWPSVSITSPADGATFHAPSTITITATASDTDGHITQLEIFDGDTKLSECAGSPCTFLWASPTPGDHTLIARATDNFFGTSSAAVTITVNPNNLPTVSIIAPTDGAVFLTSSNISIIADATDVDGAITRVEYFDGGIKLGERTNAPFTFVWANAAAGTHTLSARATDNSLDTSTSGEVVITVSNAPPSIAITNPVAGATLIERTNLTIKVQAGDANGTVKKVEYFSGTTLIGQSTNSPFSLTWSNLAVGTYELTAKATDNENADNTSAVVNITVVTNTLPTVSISAPTDGATFMSSSNITITASALDSDGTITLLEIFDGGSKLSQRTNSPFTFVLTNASIGQHTLTARATDNLFGSNTSDAVVITVTNPLPSISITNPVNGAVFMEKTNIALKVQTSDVNGTVKKVEYFAGPTLIGQSTNSPFSITWSNIPPGIYALTARATDNGGASNTSVAVNINVNSNTPPSVTVTTPANGAVFNVSSNISITATASDNDGAVTLLEIFDGATRLSQRTNSPLTFVWTNAAAGQHTLTARATDNLLGSNTSTAIVITVTNPPPSVAVTNPVEGAAFLATSNITIRAQASDVNGTVTKVQFFAGTTLLGQSTTSPYSLTWSNVPAGTYALTARATDNGGASNNSVAVNISVVTNLPPSVSITNPVNGAVVVEGTNLTIKAQASDVGGTITKVQFYAGTTLLGQSTTNPYSITWSNIATGAYALTARATDNGGLSNTSAIINLTVNPNQLPAVSLTAPTNSAIFNASSNVTITATGSDTDGTITLLELFDGPAKLSQGTSSPFTFVWTNAATGPHTLTARAKDNLSGSNTSAAIVITVTNPPPSVAITNPVEGSAFLATSNITIKAQASDVNGTVKKVEFFSGATLLGQSTNSPFSLTWSNVPVGLYALTARATDNGGASNNSAAINISVVTNLPPSVAITNPVNGALFFPNANIAIKAQAGDVGGTVTKVEFFSGATLLGQSTTSPYSLTWSNVAIGNYNLTAKATDNSGTSTTSTPVAIAVSSNSLPTASIDTPASGSVFIITSNVTITASASDSDGTIALLEMFDGATKLSSCSGSPCTFVWKPTNTGPHTLTARATDNRSQSNTSAAIVITVTNQPPTVSISSPTNGAVFFEKTNIAITASASTLTGTVKKMEIYNGTTLLGSSTKTPLTVTWSTVPVGGYTLTARATYNSGVISTSYPVNVKVTNPPPSIAITNPIDGATFPANTNITLRASASDLNGTVTNVQYFAGTNLLGKATNSPYSVTWSNVASGSYFLTARATDNGGVNTTSAGISIGIGGVSPAEALIQFPEVPLLIGDVFSIENSFTFSIPTQPDTRYTVEYTASLDAPDWQPLTTIEGTGGNETVSDLIEANSQRFYRVRIESP